jgi:RNA polymerase sigma-70 factor (ECF subfamily)
MINVEPHEDDRRDLELLASCRAGNQSALRELYDKYHRRVFNIAYRMLGNEQDAEELVPEVFLKVWRNSHSFKGKCKFSTWLHQIACNLAVDRLRARRTRKSMFLEDLPTPEVIPGFRSEEYQSPENIYLRAEEVEQLHNAIQRLSDEERLLVTLYHLQGCSYEEIEEITGIKPSNIKSKLFRARQRLKRYLLAYDQERPNELQTDTGETGRLLFAEVQRRGEPANRFAPDAV